MQKVLVSSVYVDVYRFDIHTIPHRDGTEVADGVFYIHTNPHRDGT